MQKISSTKKTLSMHYLVDSFEFQRRIMRWRPL